MGNFIQLQVFRAIIALIILGTQMTVASQWKEFPLATSVPLNSRANDANETSQNIPIITSFKYNPPGIDRSEYVDYTFGDKALVYTSNERKQFLKKVITESEILVIKSHFKSSFKQYHEAIDRSPSCSIDMLAYLVPTEPGDAKISTSFLGEIGINPADTMYLGNAQLIVPSKEENGSPTLSLKCYYRHIWRNGHYNLHQLVLFCPSFSQGDCQKFEGAAKTIADGSGRKEIQLKMTMKPLVPKRLMSQVSKYPDWVSNFKAYMQPKDVYEAPMKQRQAMKKTIVEVAAALKKIGKLKSASEDRDTHILPQPGVPYPPISDEKGKAWPQMVVCSSAPYVTSHSEDNKHVVNMAMISEFVKYYLKIGFRVIFYDRAGGHMSPKLKRLLDESIESQKKPNPEDRNYFVYKDFTMLEALLSTANISSTVRNGAHYDNTEVGGDSQKRRAHINADKIVTFSQCRHEAEAMWGIGNVLVVDFDEFLVCPAPGVPITAVGQKRYIRSLIANETANGRSTLLFHQRTTANTTAMGQVPCMEDKVKKGESIFQCYAGYETVAGTHSIKSLHLGYQCPFTQYHQAANLNSDTRMYDCGDGNYYNVRVCGLLHLTTHPKSFDNPCCGVKSMSAEKLREMRKPDSSELYRIMQSS